MDYQEKRDPVLRTATGAKKSNSVKKEEALNHLAKEFALWFESEKAKKSYEDGNYRVQIDLFDSEDKISTSEEFTNQEWAEVSEYIIYVFEVSFDVFRVTRSYPSVKDGFFETTFGRTKKIRLSVNDLT